MTMNKMVALIAVMSEENEVITTSMLVEEFGDMADGLIDHLVSIGATVDENEVISL